MSEILIAHLINQFIILVGQTTLVYLVMLHVFGIPCTGNAMLAAILTLLQGLAGMSYGSSVIRNDQFRCLIPTFEKVC